MSLVMTAALLLSTNNYDLKAHVEWHPIPPAKVTQKATKPRGDVLALKGDKWRALAMCESRMRQNAHSANGRYHSFFQWALSTWHSLGYTGDPHDYPYEVQVEAAQRLQARSGWGQWPTCARKLGLR